MNPFTHEKRDVSKIFQKKPEVPDRVEVPGVDQEAVDRLQEGFDEFARTRLGYLRGMMHKGAVPYMGTARWKRPRRKTTAHVRRMRSARARSAFLRER